MKKLLWVGDSPECPSGFGRATREILDRVRDAYDVTVLGINHRGDPGTVPYPVYTAAAGGDPFGVGRLIWMCDLVKPDVIVIQNDGWYFPYYFAKLRKRTPSGEYEFSNHAAIPVVAAVALDGKNFNGEWLKDVTTAVFWTQFALDEARIGGYAGAGYVIPLGVDLNTFYPVSKDGARDRQKIGSIRNMFIVGNVNRNQPRKRWDLTIRYFSDWVKSRKVEEARLYLHTAPTGDESVDVLDLAKYYGVLERLVLYTPEAFYGKPDEDMRDTYNCFDVAITTSQGEGMGLTTMEAMACGVPCVVPDWAALGDWAKGAAMTVPCPTVASQSFHNLANIIGGVADQRAFVEALDLIYRDKDHRKLVADLGRARVQEDRFRWSTVGDQWIALLDGLLAPKAVIDTTIWQELDPEVTK